MANSNIFKRITVISLLFLTFFTSIAYSAKISKKAEEKKENLKSIVCIFPTETQKLNQSTENKVMTGVFKEEIFERKSESKVKDNKIESGKEKKQKIEVLPIKKINDETIAWINLLSSYYHDPYNNCQNIEDRVMIDNKEDIVGLEPCPDCFKKRKIIPKFIQKEFEDSEIADSNHLMINSEFIKWISERLPIKEMNFISGTMVKVYANLEMTNKGLYQLALKIQDAYLQKTWRVIEVQVKLNPTSNKYVSSFSDSEKPIETEITDNKQIENNSIFILDNQKSEKTTIVNNE